MKKQSGRVIANAQMVGDRRKYNVLLVCLTAKGSTGEQPGGNDLDGAALGVVKGVTTISDACKSPEFIAFVERCVKATNANGEVCPSAAARIAKFTILPRDLSSSGGELTATLKLRRKVSEQMHARALEALYDDANPGPYVPYPSGA